MPATMDDTLSKEAFSGMIAGLIGALMYGIVRRRMEGRTRKQKKRLARALAKHKKRSRRRKDRGHARNYLAKLKTKRALKATGWSTSLSSSEFDDLPTVALDIETHPFTANFHGIKLPEEPTE